jgi:glycosyltransferase involved in cell wall biosynthesis
MRIAYLVTWSGGAWTGVFKKIVDQVSAWQELGAEVGVFVATDAAGTPDWRQVPQVVHVETYASAPASFLVQRSLVAAVHAWAPDITYVRTSPRQAVAAGSLAQLPHVIEIQTNDIAEARGISTPRLLLTIATRKRCLSSASGLVFVSHELAALPSYSGFTPNRVVIGNGIDLARFQPLAPTETSDGVRLAFMGLPGRAWHGLDDVFRLAQARPQWSFDLIGPSRSDVPDLANIHAYGELSSVDYLPILGRADAAISTLGWYVNDMSEASPLKSREYLALGLPVIGGYRDTDIPEESPVYLRVDNRPGAIVDDLTRVEEFVTFWRGRRVAHGDIAFLDTRVKERQRLEFLQSSRR